MQGAPPRETWEAKHLEKWACGLGCREATGRGARKTEERGRDASERTGRARTATHNSSTQRAVRGSARSWWRV
jgi:hypothetical protein